jgi:6-phosphogluconolactonase
MAMLTVVDDEAALARVGAARCAEIASEAVRARGRAIVSLTGGTTPQRMYETLARNPGTVPWHAVHLFWGDERHVPPDHKDSNYGMARDALIAHVPIPPAQVHRMRGELPAERAAADYERELIAVADREGRHAERRPPAAAGDARLFDLMLLGLGDDAHIASIFPGSPVLDERVRLVAAPWAPHLDAFRITLTPPALLDAHRIVMVVAGEKKAAAVAAAIEGPEDARRWPAQLLRAAGDIVEWIIDRAAARALASQRG